MPLQTYGPQWAFDKDTTKPIAGATLTVTDWLTGVPYQTLDLDGQPRAVVTNRNGHFAEWALDVPYGTTVRVRAGGWEQTMNPNGFVRTEDSALTSVQRQERALAPIQAALANAVNAEARILVLGDSVSEGAIEPWAQPSDRWVSQLQRLLREAHPVPGVAPEPVGFHGIGGYVPAYYEWGDLPDLTASGDVVQRSDRGIGMRSVTLGPGGKVSFSADLTSFRVHLSGDGTFAIRPQVKVDGVVVDGVTGPPSTEAPSVWQSPTYPSGVHSVEISNAESSFIVILLGVEILSGDQGKSVHVYDGSRSGHAVAVHDADASTARHARLIAPDLVVVALGYNDLVFHQSDPPKYRRDLAQFLSALRDGGMVAPILLLALPEINGPSVARWSDYVEAMRVVAREDLSAYVLDLTVSMPPADFVSSGYFASGIHPTALGHARIAELVAERIMTPVVKPAPSPTDLATTEHAGLVELATVDEAVSGAADDLAVTPAGAKALTSGFAITGHSHTTAQIEGLSPTVQAIVAALVKPGTGVTTEYDPVAETLTINATLPAGGGDTDPEIVRDVIGGALVPGQGVSIVVDDAGDTITISSTAVLPTRTISASTGLLGGGDLTSDRAFAVNFAAAGETSSSKAIPASDARLSDARTPTAHQHPASDITGTLAIASIPTGTTGSTVALGNHNHRQAINTQTGTTYTLVLADENKLVTCSNTAAITVTVPTNATAAFPIGSRVDLAALNTGMVTVTGAGGVTTRATPSATTRARYSAASLTKIGTDEWLLVGDLA